MRLLNVHTKKLHTFYNENIPSYAILSHMWLADDEEVTFAQIQTPGAYQHLPGFRKIEFLCQQAFMDGYEYAWIDTCCIDKTSSAELSEAINSMFAWYRDANVCYAYLADAEDTSGEDNSLWLQSRWWTRAWTLQEFLAPKRVIFYNRNWVCIGAKSDLISTIETATGIDQEMLQRPQVIFERSVAQRMSWAARRQATRTEDIAYSLLGIFEINMPLLYGEGTGAFLRLQREILRTVNDQTLFAWGFETQTPELLRKTHSFPSGPTSLHGLFADKPSRFANCGNIISLYQHAKDSEIRIFNGAVNLDIPLVPQPQLTHRRRDISGNNSLPRLNYEIGLLPCGLEFAPGYLVGILLARRSNLVQFSREKFGEDVFTFLLDCRDVLKAESKTVWIGDRRLEGKEWASYTILGDLQYSMFLDLEQLPDEYTFAGVLPPQWTWDESRCMLRVKERLSAWPERVAVALYSETHQHLISVFLQLTVPPDGGGYIELFSDKGVTASEASVRILDVYRFARPPTTGETGVKDGYQAHIKGKKIFNHIMTTVTVARNQLG